MKTAKEGGLFGSWILEEAERLGFTTVQLAEILSHLLAAYHYQKGFPDRTKVDMNGAKGV